MRFPGFTVFSLMIGLTTSAHLVAHEEADGASPNQVISTSSAVDYIYTPPSHRISPASPE